MNPAATLPKPAFNPWPYSLIAFFVILIALIGGMVTWSMRQDMDLVGADYYDQEMRFQQRIDSTKRAQAFGGQVGIAYAAGQIRVSLPAAQAAQHPAGTIRLYRPSDAKLDREVKLAVNADGTQQVATAGLLPGLWKARVAWTVGGEEFFRDETLIIPAAGR
jgi:nitrogen fixation protein FixH